jgi:antitoxin ParD1/3/4
MLGEAVRMNVSLTPELEQLVSELVESGRYRSASEVVTEGLRLHAVRDEADRVKLGALRLMIQEGIDSGPAVPLDMDEIIATVRAERVRLDATTGAAE